MYKNKINKIRERVYEIFYHQIFQDVKKGVILLVIKKRNCKKTNAE